MNPFQIIPHFRKIPKKILLLSSAIVILVVVAVSGTLAFMSAKTKEVNNNFTPGVANITVSEPNGSSYTISNDNSVCKVVAITNLSTPVSGSNPIPVYVRVRLVPVMRHANGAEGTGEPMNVNYNFVNPTKWIPIGDYYYYNEVLKPGDTSKELINGATITSGIPQGEKLEIQVIADSIQTVSDDELIKTWGIPFNGGTWSKPAP